jgi:uncharacterized protein YjbI with pentapeptide repeats
MKVLENDKMKVIKQIRLGLVKELKKYDVKGLNATISDSSRIKLPKEYEDDILFDYYYDEDGIAYKRFAIRYDLHKIDLSGVDIMGLNLDQDSKSRLDLSYSNLNIDFTKLYQVRAGRKITVANVDFSHMDLYKSKLACLDEPISFVNCDLSSSNIRLPFSGELTRMVEFEDCDLSYNDFSFLGIFYVSDDAFETENRLMSFKGNCSLNGTGLKIAYNASSVLPGDREYLRKCIKKVQINGCCINGKKIYSQKDWYNAKLKALTNYKKFLNEEAQRVIDDIHGQITGTKKKELKN